MVWRELTPEELKICICYLSYNINCPVKRHAQYAKTAWEDSDRSFKRFKEKVEHAKRCKERNRSRHNKED